MGDSGPRTLAIDVGGTGLKAVVLDPEGEMISERVRVETPYPCPPLVLLDALDKLAKTQPEYDRVSVGFPGAIRRGRVREVPAFSRRGQGEPPDPDLVRKWSGFELEDHLQERFHGRFAEGLSIEVACGDHHREKIGNKAWRKLVMSALDTFEAMVLPDHIFIGGGDAKGPAPGTPGPHPTGVPHHP